MKTFLKGARRAGPYLLVELLLPGGTLVALLIFIVRYAKNLRTRNPAVRGSSRVIA
jgi:hypothetical protein